MNDRGVLDTNSHCSYMKAKTVTRRVEVQLQYFLRNKRNCGNILDAKLQGNRPPVWKEGGFIALIANLLVPGISRLMRKVRGQIHHARLAGRSSAIRI